MKFPKKLVFLSMTIILQTSGHSITNTPTSDSREPTLFGDKTQQTISKISLQWMNKAAMKIVWPDQGEDVIVMTVSKQFPDLVEECLFEGSPENKNSTIFSAAIIGCMDSEETIVNLGVKNEVLELTLLKNGTTLQNIWIQQQSTETIPVTISTVREPTFIINEDLSRGCICSNKTSESIECHILGKCSHKYNDKFFCYVDKKLQPECCEEDSTRFVNYCVSYSICEPDAPGFVPNPRTTNVQEISNDIPPSGFPREPTFFGDEIQQTISETSLQWLNNGTMKIVWPDKGEDFIVMTVSKQFPDLEDACMFEGNPKNENSSFTSVIIGCMDSEETIVNLGVKNKVLELLLLKNGTTLQSKRGKCAKSFVGRQTKNNDVCKKFSVEKNILKVSQTNQSYNSLVYVIFFNCVEVTWKCMIET